MLNKSWSQHLTKQQLYGHLPPIMKAIQVRRTRHTRHCWRSKDELISDIRVWIPSRGGAKSGRPVKTYIQQLCADIVCSLENQLEAMDDREDGTTWCWWMMNCVETMAIQVYRLKNEIADKLSSYIPFISISMCANEWLISNCYFYMIILEII